MNKFPFVFFVLLFYCPFVSAQSAVDYEFDPIIVTASRFPTTFSHLARNVSIIDSEQIKTAPVFSIQDLLSYAGSVELNRRAPHGIQAEAGIRGGSFEETLVLIDGIKINNPQTAHHNFDFPVEIGDVERIEILHGHGSGIYGADALTGVINIITKKKLLNSINIYGGDYKLAGGYLSLGKQTGKLQNNISIHSSRSAGYNYNTDFEAVNLFVSSSFHTENTRINFKAGYNDKDFGANNFYSSSYPDEREHTKTILSALKAEFFNGRYSLAPQISWINHKDDFFLDYNRPAWFRNIHTSNSYGLEFPFTTESKLGLFSFGGKYEYETLQSTNLGNHERKQGGVFFDYQKIFHNRIIINTASHLFYYSKWGWKFWPGIDIAYRVNEKIKLYSSAGRSFRMPSFTELYYTSPANMGNPDLIYSRAVSIETGTSRQTRHTYTNISLFYRNGINMIDWARKNDSEPWQVMNVTRLKTRGLEFMYRYAPELNYLSHVQLDFTYLDSEKNTEAFQSKYLLNYINYQVNFSLVHRLPFGMTASWKLKHVKYQSNNKYLLNDIALYRNIKRGTYYIKITNLFNTDYYEVKDVVLPGRWFSAGIQQNF
ncbi:TonB-dependent receptor [candidate division KSB1 bacterium]|nr:TonB-dependent receptor [candidate division KSB1 bacterium]